MRNEKGVSSRRKILPFTAIVGQEKMKKALILNAINPRTGGVLIRGEKGTAKSTAVRALAELLPEIEVVNGCPFNCNPYDGREMCDLCYGEKENGAELEVIKKRVRVVDLPLGATEDRVVGALDIEHAIKEGIKALQPGILAEVNRGILYIDEVNLLDDHVADVLLDSAAMGVNVIEREGISVAHPSNFILIGTMNPEEGELRPQLLDRFGLQASVESIDDPDKRMEIVKVAEGFENDPNEFRSRFEDEQTALRVKIVHAKQIVNEVEISDDLLKITAATCIELGVRTHRAEIVIVRTAKTIAAFDGRKNVTLDDIKEAMELALPHRMRRKPFEPPHLDSEKLDEMMSETKKQHEGEKEENEQHQQQKKEGEEKREKNENEEHQHKNEHLDNNPENQDDDMSEQEPQKESVFSVGDPIDTKAVRQKQKKDRLYRRKISGRRIPTLSLHNNGKYTRYGIPKGAIKDVALDATIRAAAPYQKGRRSDTNSNLSVVIKTQDIREKIRVGKVSTATMFVVDASGSMGANRRMESAKGAVLSLLLDSYQQRDKVGMVAFRGNQADVLLPLCSSVDLAYKSLKELPTGGRTPLAAGLERGLNLLMNEKQKDEGAIPVLLLISDGRANVSPESGTKEIKMELVALAEQAQTQGIQVIVIDTEVVNKSFIQMQLGYCRDIASYSGGKYYSLSNLTSQKIHDIVVSESELLVDLRSVWDKKRGYT